jgi:hypothetical protein
MARSVDVQATSPQSEGWNMITGARVSHAHPSLARGCNPTALAGGDVAAGSPGAVLGTGMNTDTYTPGIEAV